MSSFLNKMRITGITYNDQVKCMCPIGMSVCTYNFTVEFEPDKVIPDYIMLHNEILGMNNGSETLESATARVFDIVTAQCSPKRLRVACHCYDAKHPAVTVVKEG